MEDISRRAKLLILGIILLEFGIISVFNTQNSKIVSAVLFFGIPLAIALLVFLPQRIKEFLDGWLFLLLIGFINTALIIVVVKLLHFESPIALFIFILLPVLFLALYIFVVLFFGGALSVLGRAYWGEKLYSNMIRLNPKFGYGYFQRGVFRQYQEEVDNALQDYETALEIAKDKTAKRQIPTVLFTYSPGMIYGYQSDIYLYQGDVQKAILECDRGLALKEQNPLSNLLLLSRRGSARLENRDYEGALVDFNRIHFEGRTARYEQSMGTVLNADKALALCALGNQNEAQILWSKAAAVNPNYLNREWLRGVMTYSDSLLDLADKILSDVNKSPIFEAP